MELAPKPARNLAAMSSSLVVANPQAMFHMRNHRFDACRTDWRPYSSDRGPMMRGPNAVASR